MNNTGGGPEGPKPRLLQPNRAQMRLVPTDLEAMVAEDHQVRAVWAFVERLDLSGFYERIGSVEGGAGRPAIDPRVLLCLWIEATLDGVGSARELERLCGEHSVYQWICGGVPISYHTLSDFRSLSADLLNEVLTDSVAVLLSTGLVELQRVAHDGVRVRASAGASSFRTGSRLRALKKIAREQVELLAEEIESDPGASRRRREAARKRAAESRARRIERALKQLPEVEKRKRSRNSKKKTQARVSTTDPDARVMKMPDGGYRPAFNIHLTADTASQVVIAFEVTNQGTDCGTMVPLSDQVAERHERSPQQWLADGGCTSLENIEAMASKGCNVYAPIRKARRRGRARTQIRTTDTPAIADWRRRMKSKEGKAIYKERAATSECVNAQFRNNGLRQLLVRGLEKVRSVVLLHILTHNMRRSWALQQT